jgi:hypothetical protein
MSPFVKGNSYGKKNEGVKKQKTHEWNLLGTYITREGADRYMNALRTLEDKDYIERFEKILEYFKPKLARSEGDLKVSGGLTIQTTNYANTTDIPAPPISVTDTISD